MALIEHANSIDKIHQQKLFRERTASTEKGLKTLSFHVYSSRHLISTTKQAKHQHSDILILPSIDKNENRYRRNTKRPSYQTSLYHSNITNSSHIDLPTLTIHRKRPELSTTIRDNLVMRRQCQHTPPPTPSNDQLDHLLIELNRTRQSTPQSSIDNDGYIPYRLPTLNQSTKQRRKEKNSSPTHVKSILTNYYQTLYSKY